MRRFTRALCLMTLGIAGATCETSEILDPNGRLDELELRREQWRANDIRDYRMEFRAGCECVLEFTQIAVVEVSGDTIQTVIIASTGLPAQQLPPDSWLTVEELFDVVEHALVDGAAQLDVSYDSELGYPDHVFMDWDAVMIDDEVGYRVLSLAVIQ